MAPHLTLRPADAADERLLWEWANDPVVRAASFSSDPIPWEDHRRWFARKLASDGTRIFIAVNEDGTPVGQVRFDQRDDGDADVGVSLAPGERGKGYGTALIAAGVSEANAPAVHAFIKTTNNASRKAFLKAGFTEKGTEVMHGQEAYHLVFTHP